MIVKESRITTKSGAGAIASHVLHGAKNEAIRVMSGSEWLLHDHMREAHREGLKYGLRHIAFNPDEAMTDEQLSAFARRLCDELHADSEHLTLVVHQKDGSTHGHLILPEWQQDHVLESRFTWMRMEKVARLEEIRLGHKLVAGRHDRAIAQALRKEGRHSEAKQVDALIPVADGAKPRAAYTSEARRITERQGLDLPALKKLVTSLWSQSDGLKAFRAALKDHSLTLREGDRKETRPGAHIIETSDGLLVGSFTRLAKVKAADFRKLLSEEQNQTEHERDVKIQSTRLSIRRTTADFYNEYPIPKPSDTQPVLRKTPVIKLLKIPTWRKELWLKKMADVDALTTEPLPSSSSVHIISAEEAYFRKEIRQAIAQQHAILAQQAPETSWKPLDRDKMIATWRKQLTPYQKQLRKSFDHYSVAKREWQDAEKSRWQRLTGKATRLERRADQLFLEFLEVLRFVVQALLHIVGLRAEPPNPIRSILSEKNKPALEHFRKTYDAEFSAMADIQMLDPWLNQRFDRIVQARQKRIMDWNRAHRDKKDAAQREIKRLSDLLNTKTHKVKHQALISPSRSRSPASFPAPNPQTRHPTPGTPSPF
ncbi:relaxase/mobilization nuclease domain-containing protein [Acetobacter senegalensis]|uniref:relaxase/mobilization nuclease domain-containing protein n=1 Tax=Acetobacter senegalensis TaxID=446692 RepID=UPI000ACF0E82|nr:hypothetical protein [Acetobacter senegalensis]